VACGECGAAGTGRFRPVSFMTERRRTDAAVACCADDRNRTRSLRLSAPAVVRHRLSATLMANALSGQLLQVPTTLHSPPLPAKTGRIRMEHNLARALSFA
jgi:hypothetical protein